MGERSAFLDELQQNNPFYKSVGNAPFPENFIKERIKIAKGREHTVYTYLNDGKKYAVKETRILTGPIFRQLNITEASDALRLYSVYQMKKADFDYMITIFGESLLPTLFIHGYSTSDRKPTNYIVQRYIDGQTLEEIPKEQLRDLRQVTNFKSQLSNMIWSTKRIFQDIGAPPDLKLANIIYENTTEKLYLVDPLAPNIIKRISEDTYNPLWSYAAIRFYTKRKLKGINSMEKFLNLSGREINELNEKYYINHKLQKLRIQELNNLEKLASRSIPVALRWSINQLADVTADRLE